MVLTTAAARSTYQVACTKALRRQGFLLLFRRPKCSPSPGRLSSRLSNCLSCSVSSLFNAHLP